MQKHHAPAYFKRHGIARVLCKMGIASRFDAALWVTQGRISVNGRTIRDPEFAVHAGRDQIALDGRLALEAQRQYVMLNKPRGLITSRSDEKGRDTVYRCFAGSVLPWLAPVGRLDKASEGLLLFSNDPQWAARLLNPESKLEKTYHVQVDRVAEQKLLDLLRVGVLVEGEQLGCVSARVFRQGGKTSWIEIVLDEGRNRHIRRLLATQGLGVLRLVRVAIGPLALGDLAKGDWRLLTAAELETLGAIQTDVE